MRSFGIVSSGQEVLVWITIFIVIVLSVNGLLFVTLGVLPLDAIMGNMADVEDIANIADRLINFMVGVARNGLSLLGGWFSAPC